MVTLMTWEQDLIVNDVSPPQRRQISLLIFDSDCLSISSLIFNLHTLAIVGGHNLGLEWFTLDKYWILPLHALIGMVDFVIQIGFYLCRLPDCILIF